MPTGDAPTEGEKGKFFTVEIDGTELRFDHSPVTAEELMAAAAIAPADGLVEVLEDGTQRQVPAGESFDLKPGRRFKKRPRFKRG